jgi:hypothetical protein
MECIPNGQSTLRELKLARVKGKGGGIMVFLCGADERVSAIMSAEIF